MPRLISWVRKSSLDFAQSVVGKGGAVIVVGLMGGRFSMPAPMFPLRELAIAGSYVGSLAEARELVGLVKQGRVKPSLHRAAARGSQPCPRRLALRQGRRPHGAQAVTASASTSHCADTIKIVIAGLVPATHPGHPQPTEIRHDGSPGQAGDDKKRGLYSSFISLRTNSVSPMRRWRRRRSAARMEAILALASATVSLTIT